jgi:hypothetical protein
VVRIYSMAEYLYLVTYTFWHTVMNYFFYLVVSPEICGFR